MIMIMSTAIELTHNITFAITIRITSTLTIAIALHMTTSRGVIIIMSHTYKYHISVTITITTICTFITAIIDPGHRRLIIATSMATRIMATAAIAIALSLIHI